MLSGGSSRGAEVWKARILLLNLYLVALEVMDAAYLDILKEWERTVAGPAVYEHLDVLFPAYGFRRLGRGTASDRWASPLKLDLSLPKVRTDGKTVVYRSDMRFREQGEWDSAVGVMDMYMRGRGVRSIYEAYRAVSAELSLPMPLPSDAAVRRAVSGKNRRDSLLDALRDYFTWSLTHDASRKAAAVRGYLKRARGFSLGDARRLGLGFVPAWERVVRYVTLERGFSKTELDAACGVPAGARGRTAVGSTHVLAIPYVCGGVMKGFLFRRIDDALGGPKYLATAGLDRKSVFFGMPETSTSGKITVVEGEMDSLKASAEGISDVVAIGGSDLSGGRRAQVEDALSRGVKSITLCLDLDRVAGTPLRGDVAARHARIMKCVHAIKDVDPSFEDIRVALFDAPSDPDEYVRTHGPAVFKALIENAVPWWKYLYRYMTGSVTEKI